MTYQDLSGSFVHLAHLVFLLVCGMTVLTIVAIGIFKVVQSRFLFRQGMASAVPVPGRRRTALQPPGGLLLGAPTSARLKACPDGAQRIPANFAGSPAVIDLK
jgi:hypothetical protein